VPQSEGLGFQNLKVPFSTCVANKSGETDVGTSGLVFNSSNFLVHELNIANENTAINIYLKFFMMRIIKM
jgi:hypothetical protein